MKRIEFIAPVEALRGNMSGSQKLVYALNDNPAYEAPDGRQYARNYKPRYIGFRRAKDGAVYFGVKRKSATKVDAAARITMAALGTIQDLKNTFKDDSIKITVGGVQGSYWGFITLSYNTGIADGEIDPATSLDKWIDGLLIDMMRYRQEAITLYLRINPNIPTKLNFTIHNPYAGPDIATLPITQRNFIKFNPALTTLGDAPVIYINGMPVVYAGEDSETWYEMRDAVTAENPNYTTQLTPLVAAGTSAVTWNGNPVYSSAGVAQTADTPLIANERYTTTQMPS